MSDRFWPRLILDAMAASWVVALIYVITGWLHPAVPLWLPLAAYLLTAVARRRSHKLALWALLTSSLAGSFALGWPPGLFPLAATFAAAFRAQALEPNAPYWALRVEFFRGLVLMLIAVIIRLLAGPPGEAALLLPAAVLVGGGLFGLPYVHGLDAVGGGKDARRQAVPGMRLGGLIAGASAALGLAVYGVRVLYLAGDLSGLANVLFIILRPLALLIAAIEQFFLAFIPKAHVQKQRSIPPRGRLDLGKAHAAPAGVTFGLHLLEALGIVLILALIGFFAYRRLMQVREAMAPANTPSSPGDLVFESAARGGRGRADYGEGARRRVRSAVGRHLKGRQRSRRETARQALEREGWPKELIELYERARYQLRRSFEHHEAEGFLRRFTAWRKRK